MHKANHPKPCKTLGTVFRDIRQKTGLSTEIVAFRAGFVSSEKIVAFENGTELPAHCAILDCIADALQCTPNEYQRLSKAYVYSILKEYGLLERNAIQWRYELID